MDKCLTNHNQTIELTTNSVNAGCVYSFSLENIPIVTQEGQKRIREAAKKGRCHGYYPEIKFCK